MTVLGYDSTHRLDHDELRLRGAVAVGRYVQTGARPTWKSVTKSEVDGYRAAGFGVWFLWETTTTRMLDGHDAGLRDGQRARAAMRALGVPDAMPVVAACDSDVEPARTIPYGHGFKAGAGAVGVYGSAGVIDAWYAAGLIGDGAAHQTNAHGWDHPRRMSPHSSIRQQLPVRFPGGDVDPNQIDPGTPLVWWPPTHHQEDLTVAQSDAIMAKLDELATENAHLREEVGAVRAGLVELVAAERKSYGSLRGWLGAIGKALGVSQSEAAAHDPTHQHPAGRG